MNQIQINEDHIPAEVVVYCVGLGQLDSRRIALLTNRDADKCRAPRLGVCSACIAMFNVWDHCVTDVALLIQIWLSMVSGTLKVMRTARRGRGDLSGSPLQP